MGSSDFRSHLAKIATRKGWLQMRSDHRNYRMHEPVIVLKHLSKSFGEVHAVEDLSFTIAPGVIFGFLGANGAGKTTTIRMLCGLTHPTSGSATIVGHDVWKQRDRARSSFGYVAQRFSLYPDLTVLENFRFFGGASRVPAAELEKRITRLLHSTDLEKKRDTPAGSLSGGMRQLLAMGCALIHDPPLLFLDEPTSGLDPVHRQQIWDLLYDLGDAGKTIFVTTHYMDEAERCTEVGFLESGRLLAKAPPRDLKSSFRTKLLELDVEPVMPALVQFREYPGVLGVSLRSGSLRIYAPEPEKILAEWKRQWPAPGIRFLGERWVDPDMEDVFTAYSQRYDALLRTTPSQDGADAVSSDHRAPNRSS
jgi:ABC-2 type transport system ATP-binding protein